MMKSGREARSSGIIMVFTFILLFSVLLQSMRMVDQMEYSEHGIPLWKGRWEDVPSRYQVPLRIEGRLSEVEYPEWGYGPESFLTYTYAMILDATDAGLGRVPTRVYLWDTERDTGLIPAESPISDLGDVSFDLGDASFSKWLQALVEGWTVEVEGRAFDVIQDGVRITLFEVEKLVSTPKSEIVYMYREVHASGGTGGVWGVSFIPLPTPTWFQVGRIYKGDRYQQENDVYRGVWLESGETIKYYFKSLFDPISFQLIYSNCSSFEDWERELILIDEPSTTTSLTDLTAEWDGFYIFGFKGGDPAPIVMFSAYRETEGVILMPAWLLGGKIGGGSGPWYNVNISDLQQFPHLIEAFEENAKARRLGYVHADHATYCPAKEAMEIIEFLGEKFSINETQYGFSLTMEDGSFYSFSMIFGWAPPIIS